jgi:DNA uptake protein ComE-like DNA-binding protein
MKILLILSIFFISLFAKVDINSANIKELRSLKGIGHTKAVAIIEL